MAPIALYPFRYRHERTGKWVRAHYKEIHRTGGRSHGLLRDRLPASPTA